MHADARPLGPLHGGHHPHLHGRVLRLRVGGIGLPHPLRQHLSHEAAETGAGHLFPAGPAHGQGLLAAGAGDPAHRPSVPGRRSAAGRPPLPRPGPPHHGHVRRLPHRPVLRLYPLLEGHRQDRPLLRRHLPGGHGLHRTLRLPGQAHRPHPGGTEKRGDAGAAPVAERTHLPPGGGIAAGGLRHAAHPGHQPHRLPLLPHAGSGHPGDPPLLPLPLRLPAAAGEGPEKALLQGPQHVRPPAVQQPHPHHLRVHDGDLPAPPAGHRRHRLLRGAQQHHRRHDRRLRPLRLHHPELQRGRLSHRHPRPPHGKRLRHRDRAEGRLVLQLLLQRPRPLRPRPGLLRHHPRPHRLQRPHGPPGEGRPHGGRAAPTADGDPGHRLLRHRRLSGGGRRHSGHPLRPAADLCGQLRRGPPDRRGRPHRRPGLPRLL